MVTQMLGDTTDYRHNCKELSDIGAHEIGSDTAVFRVPPEVMGQIFVACLDPCCLHVDHYFHAYDEETTPNISPSSTPLVLLRVCRTWRRIALGTPELFTRLFLHRRNHVDPGIIVPMWLQHSGKLPLDIVVRPESWYSSHINNNNSRAADVRPLLSLIHQNIHRVRTLRCGAFLEECLPHVENIFMGSLREFTLTSSFYSSQNSYKSGTVMAPNLEVFQILQGAHYHHALDFIAWGPKLRIYRNEGVFQSLTNLATILLNSPNLEVCILQMGARNTGSRRDWESLKIRLPRLCRLHLTSIESGGEEFEDLCPFLNCLEAPNLEFLDMQNDIYTRPEQDFVTSFRSLFPAANANLKILRLHRFDTESIDLESLLPKFTELSELSIEWGLCDEAMFRVLASPSICSKLSSLSLVYTEVTGPGLYGLIRERIESRNGRESLREVVLWQCNGLDISEGIKIAALMQKHQEVHWYVSGLFEIEPS